MGSFGIAVLTLCLAFGHGSPARAQELETRFYTSIPIGLNLLQLGNARSTGNILIDQSLPVEGLDATLNLTKVSWLWHGRIVRRGRASQTSWWPRAA